MPSASVPTHSGNTSSTSWATKPIWVPVKLPCFSGSYPLEGHPADCNSLSSVPCIAWMFSFSARSEALPKLLRQLKGTLTSDHVSLLVDQSITRSVPPPPSVQK